MNISGFIERTAEIFAAKAGNCSLVAILISTPPRRRLACGALPEQQRGQFRFSV